MRAVRTTPGVVTLDLSLPMTPVSTVQRLALALRPGPA